MQGQCFPVAAIPGSPTEEPSLVITTWKSSDSTSRLRNLGISPDSHPPPKQIQESLSPIAQGNGANGSLPAKRPTSSPSDQQLEAPPTTCIQQQVPGVEVPAQYTLLVKSL